jgi:hypothetical protein
VFWGSPGVRSGALIRTVRWQCGGLIGSGNLCFGCILHKEGVRIKSQKRELCPFFDVVPHPDPLLPGNESAVKRSYYHKNQK